MLPVVLYLLILAVPNSKGADAEFEKWAQIDAIKQINFILGSASTSTMFSWFGHLLLQVEYDPEKSSTAAGLSPYFQLGVRDDEVRQLSRAKMVWLGLTGGLSARFSAEPAFSVEQRHLLRLGRSFKKFKWKLSRAQIRSVMKKLWIATHEDVHFPYFFLSQNCASLTTSYLLDALEPETHWEKSTNWIQSPGRELKARADSIEVELPDIPSERLAASFEWPQREKLAAKLFRPDLRTRLNSFDVETRTKAYEEIPLTKKEEFQFFLHSIPLELYHSSLRKKFSDEKDASYDSLIHRYAVASLEFKEESEFAYKDYEKFKEENREVLEVAQKSRLKSGGFWNITSGYSRVKKSNRIHFETGLLNEEMGKSRVFGGNAGGEFKILYGGLDYDVSRRKIPAYEATLFDYLNLKEKLPLLETQPLSWRMKIHFQKENALEARDDFIPEFAFLLNIFSNFEYANYILAGAGARSRIELKGKAPTVGVPLTLRARKQISYHIWSAFSAFTEVYPELSLHHFVIWNKLGSVFEWKILSFHSNEVFLKLEAEYFRKFRERHQDLLKLNANLTYAF